MSDPTKQLGDLRYNLDLAGEYFVDFRANVSYEPATSIADLVSRVDHALQSAANLNGTVSVIEAERKQDVDVFSLEQTNLQLHQLVSTLETQKSAPPPDDFRRLCEEIERLEQTAERFVRNVPGKGGAQTWP